MRCLKILSHFGTKNSWQLRPEWMILSVLPESLPPDFSPLIKIGGDRPFTSDLIPLYRKPILNRNKRVSTLSFRKLSC